ncbi:hypothetical protein [Streptomyces ochraceiscleroticus]|uniref:Uncharacterized protein n=1 Tax=Streptomyces ochraceiscleroticus TaxID=47761 RepID=A0ABW1MKU7_9ACTN|nr:hypothetical protein [Streptomyces ochraceiscleroticus]
MTNFDSDAALDALLGAADDAVLGALTDGLDLVNGLSATGVTPAPAPRGSRAGTPGPEVAEAAPQDERPRAPEAPDPLPAPLPASSDSPSSAHGSAPADDNVLVSELLELLQTALEQLDTLQRSLDRLPYSVSVEAVSAPLAWLREGVALRTADAAFALGALGQAERLLKRSYRQLLVGKLVVAEESDVLVRSKQRAHSLLRLVQAARPLVVRLFADETDCSALPLPTS